jgi:AcrR family transcriptional regulator
VVETSAERGRQVRRKLTAAAVALIAERGWGAVSTRMVAERAGVAPGLVHYHFASLHALLAESAVGAMRVMLEQVGPLLASARTPREALDLLLASVDAYSGTDPMSRLFVETYLAATRDDQIRAEVASVLMEFRGRLARWLGERGVADPERTTAVLAAAVDGVLLHRALDPGLTAEAVRIPLRRMVLVQGGDESTGSARNGDR